MEAVMEPSRVRAQILAEHDRLRARLTQLEEGIRTFVEGSTSQLRGLVDDTRSLLEDFIGHTELEDSVLSPVLLDADAWGPVRAHQLRESHVEQRRELRALLAFITQGSPVHEFKRRTLKWIACVRLDMREEEHSVLCRSLLRDDVVAVAMESG